MLDLICNLDIEYFTKWASDKNKQNEYIKYFSSDKYSYCFDTIKNDKETISYIDAAIKTINHTQDPHSVIGPLSNFVLRYLSIIDNNSYIFGNIYECLLDAADNNTQQTIFPTNDNYRENINEIEIIYQGRTIGAIGRISDLFYLIFDHYINKTEYIETEYGNYENINILNDLEDSLALQIWDIEIIKDNTLIENILYHCSSTLGLNFKKRYLLEEIKKFERLEIDLNMTSLIKNITPLIYFNHANESSSPRIKYLAYYQSIEFYFTTMQNNFILDKIKNIKNESNILIDDINKSISEIKSELNCLKFLLYESYGVERFIIKNITSIDYYSQNIPEFEICGINTANNNIFINNISKRIYQFRCAIVHSKDNSKNLKLIPNITDTLIQNELDLVKDVAQSILDYWN